MELIGLDFETYASTDLLKHGLHRYINCPDFTPLLAVAVWKDDEDWGGYSGVVIDFVEDYEEGKARLLAAIKDSTIVAHNAGFEQSVLARMGIALPSDRFVDSAVLARAAGAAGKLEAAAPQLLGTDKMAVGYELIKLFSIPGKYQEAANSLAFDPQIRADHLDEWAKFAEYCGVDAELSLKLALNFMVSDQELANNAVTMDMNNTGWHVDMNMVDVMQRRYQANITKKITDFRILTGADDLNLSSFPQLKEWCAKRGVRATSFDEAHVERLIKQLDKKISATPDHTKHGNYVEVRAMLHTKRELGGSSLKKLVTIIDTTGDDGRLHDQYLHYGASATGRTTGRGVQMQNLKRLNGQGDDMDELFDIAVVWENGKLAANLRQVFTATDPQGQLVVGDFSSVESRGLAWQAGEQWKLDAYREGYDLYSVLAARILGLAGGVTKAERQLGKVGELACGYGAGPEAVKDFAEKMGVSLTEGEATKLVKDWRAANPQIVQYWERLDEALHMALLHNHTWRVTLPHAEVVVRPFLAPQSLRDQVANPNLLSLKVSMYLHDHTKVLARVIHGCEIKGRNIQYWKPSERKTGDLWSNEFVNPKTKRLQRYTVYGGKLAGLLTQSLCREVFFDSLREVHAWVQYMDNVHLVGQFHDEIVLDWEPMPGGISLSKVKDMLEQCMAHTKLPAFPLAAEIKSDYRYTK